MRGAHVRRGTPWLLLAALTATVGSVSCGHAVASLRFSAPRTYKVPFEPQSVAIGDVTGDGRRDVLITSSHPPPFSSAMSLYLFRQRRSGSLVRLQRLDTYFSDSGEMGVDTGDVNRDGHRDVVVATESGVNAYYQRHGRLHGPDLIRVRGRRLPTEASEVVARNMDGDHDVDLVVTGNGGIWILRHRRHGWGASNVATYGGELEVARMNRDRRPDVVSIANPTDVYLSRRRGGYSRQRVFDNLVFPSGGEAADVTGDGRPDVAITDGRNRPDSKILVHRGRHSGRIRPDARVYQSYDIPEPIEAADMNRDGRRDLVTLHGGWKAAGIYLQSRRHTLRKERLFHIPYRTHYNPKGLALGDVSGDRRADIVVAGDEGLVVLRSRRARHR